MAKKKSKSFGKHIYALVAIIVLLVAAGIASYGASVPSGSPTHGDLYVNTIFGKGRAFVDVNDTLKANAGVEGTGNIKGISGIATEPVGGVGVEGRNTGSGTSGELGLRSYGVRGTGSVSSGAGVYGEGYYGTQGVSTNTNGYGGHFSGGKGLYASKIEFGSTAFDQYSQGLLVLAALSTSYTCQAVCANHGLACAKVFSQVGIWLENTPCNTITATPRYCWCD